MTYFLSNLHYFLLLISVIVFFHELGHFLVAKLCGVQVLRFSLGFGPRLFSTTYGDTEYQISLLPLGGYVKMLGDTPGADIPDDLADQAFANKSVGQRTAIVLAGPTFNMVLALTVYFVMGLGTHQFGDTKLGVVSANEPAYQAGLRPGDRVVAIGGTEVHRWDELRQAIAAQPKKSLQVTYERPTAGGGSERRTVALVTQTRREENEFNELETRGKIGVSMQYLKPIVAVVDPLSPAAVAGLRTGDTVLQVNQTPVEAWHEVRSAVAATPLNQKIVLRVRRAAAPSGIVAGATGTGAPGTAVSAADAPGSGPTEVLTLQPAALRTDLDSGLFSAADTPWGYTGLASKDTLIASLDADSSAAQAGLLVGDRVLHLTLRAADGTVSLRPIGVWGIDLATFGLSADSDLSITVQRGSAVLSRSFRLQQQQHKDAMQHTSTALVFGAHNDPEVLGSYLFERRVGAVESLQQALVQLGDDMTLVARGLGKMVRRTLPLTNMGGPIMLFVIAEKSAKLGAAYYFHTMAMISVNIGIINLLPIPVLDGGHLFFFLIEAISRRPPSVRVRAVANTLGLAMLLCLMVYTLGNDVLRFVLQ
jgi:regulator of sigma E protease